MALQNKRDETFIKHVSGIVNSHLKEEGFGVSELARLMNMGRTTLHRKIKSATELTVSQFIRIVRLNRALEILRNEPLTVAEVAYVTGFGSATYFSRCFRDHFGFPPVEVTRGNSGETGREDPEEEAIIGESSSLMFNFPAHATTFIGREEEISSIKDLLEKHRIVSLVGSGGCGKTRLACEVAAQLLKEYPDGICFVDLAPLESEELVEKQVLASLKLTEAPGREILDTVVEGIRDKKLLILLDNCEHLLRTCARVAQQLMVSVPDLTLLVTSREVLNIKGEKLWLIPSLSLTDPEAEINLEQAESSEAVRLFKDRARMNNPLFDLVEENVSTVSIICHKVDGLPLAIELVASRTRHMDTHTLLNRVSERFDRIPSLDPEIVERHKTIEAAIEWSYKLLTEDEKTLFSRLSVFTGGFDLSAVEEVCTNESLPVERILDLLSQLVEKSMIQTIYQPGQQMRYKLLETLHRYASNLLDERGETKEFRNRHLEYFTRMAEKAYEEQHESQSKWIDWLNKERNNVMSAMNWAESNNAEYFAQISGFLGWYWRIGSDLLMGVDYAKRALATTPDLTETRARNLLGLGLLTWMTGDSQGGVTHMQKSLEIWRNLEIPRETAITLSELSEPLLHSGKREDSLKSSEEALGIARELGKPGLINHCLIYYSICLVHTKQYAKGEPLVEELLHSSEKLDNIYGIETALHLHGDCAVGRQDFKEGERRYAKGVEISYKNGNLAYAAFDMQGIAFALSGQGRYAKVIRLDAAAREQFKELGMEVDGMVIFWDEWIASYIEGAKKAIGKDLTQQYQQEGMDLGFESAVAYALDFSMDL